MYIKKSIQEYLHDLAARKPAPGGGSAAALSASIGVSLISMVANYTAGNPKYAGSDARARKILAASEEARAKLETLIDADVDAYNKLSSAMRMKKASIEEDYKAALNPPYEVCRISAECMKLCEELLEVGNRNLITDTAIAAILLEGAFFSAKFNVYINLKYIQDVAYIEKIHKFLAPLEEKLPKMKEEILERCEEVI
jgi:formiminotetrahydrofolate cyclodeaminase